jgi:anti-sigma-K factor RskA
VNDGRDTRSGHESYHDDLAAYALDALPKAEATELERHLEGCEACRRRLRWLRPAVDLLPRSVEQLEPPPRLRKRLLATVRAEARQAQRAEAEGAAPSRLGDWRASLWRPATAVAAGAILVAGVAGGYLLHQPGDSSSLVAARPTSAAPRGAAGTLEREDSSAILRVARLPALPKNEVYETWVQRDGTMHASSLFVLRRDRTADAAVPGPLGEADAVLVTREPRGGSRKPTSPPLLRADLD